MRIELVVIGAGGHAKVVLDTLQKLEESFDIAVYDQNPLREGELFLEAFRIRYASDLTMLNGGFHIAVGDNAVRAKIFKHSVSLGGRYLSVVHPMAVLAASAVIEEGVFVAAGAIVSTDAIIHKGTIVNHAAIIDHDCIVDSFAHIAPNATLGGGVHVGEYTLIGAGAIVLPGVKVGRSVTVGAGAVVTEDVVDGVTVIGNPARCFIK